MNGQRKPFFVNTPRFVPYAFRDKLEKEIALLEAQSVIKAVTEPTEWCAPIVVTPKKNSDDVRLCVDFSKLNKYVLHEHYRSCSPAEAVANRGVEHDKAFQQCKMVLAESPTLALFELTRETRLMTDASGKGLGFILQLRNGDHWSVIQAGSRFLTSSETRYGTIEKEMLGIV